MMDTSIVWWLFDRITTLGVMGSEMNDSNDTPLREVRALFDTETVRCIRLTGPRSQMPLSRRGRLFRRSSWIE